MKNNRMMMAEAIQKAFLSTTKTQANGLKDVIEHINESILIDCLLSNALMLSSSAPTTVSYLMSNIINSIASEVLYSLFLDEIRESERENFDNLLAKCNIWVNKGIKNRDHTTRNNLLPIILKIDQKMIDGRYFYRKLFGAKFKAQLVEIAKKKTKLIRPLIHNILNIFNSEANIFEYTTKPSKKFSNTICVIGVKPTSYHMNYMSKVPNTIMDIECPVQTDRVSLVTQSIDVILNMTFTFDNDYNDMITGIVDKPIFEKILAGKSTNTGSINAKVTQARSDIKEGLGFWNDLGKGNVYFKYVVDFRGRISQLGGLSSVGHKVGKSMLRSGQAHRLGTHGYNHILMALAGAVGYDKETFDVRLAWAKENVDTYVEIGKVLLQDAEKGFELLMDTDSPFDCAVLALELFRISEHKGMIEDYCSNIFVGYDATCSAVQLVGLLMGNKRLTEASNVRVSETTEDRIYDSYMLLADIMDEAAPKAITAENEEDIKLWMSLDAKQKRAIAKPLLMTRLYGSKMTTHIDSVREVAIDKGIVDSADGNKTFSFGVNIAKLFNFAFDNEEGFNSLRSYEKFTKAIAKAYNSKEMSTKWSIQDASTFNPQNIVATYMEFAGDQYSVYMDGKKHVLRTYKLDILGECKNDLEFSENKKLNARRAVSAIAPNFIHSHDAIVLHSTVTDLKKPMRLTHDCFATTPGSAQEMLDCINKAYVELFGDNRLKQIEKLQEECYLNTGILVELPDNYNAAGISSDEIEKAKYKFS